MKSKKIVFALMSLLLCGCNNLTSNSPTNSSFPSSVSQEPISRPSTSIPTESVSFTFPIGLNSSSTSKQPSESGNSKPSLPPISTSTSIEDPRTKIDESDFTYFIADAYMKDDDYKSVTVLQYSMSSSSYSSYTKRQYTMTAYTNNITLYSGSYLNSEPMTQVSATFKTQRMYQNGVYSEIRKYPNTFRNYAHKEEMTEDDAKPLLNIGQSALAYAVVSQFKQNYEMTYEGYLEEDETRHFTYTYIDDYVDNNNYVLCALIEIRLDKNNYLTDFFYSEGYYDSWYTSSGISALRRHGAVANKKGGYSYEMVAAIKGTRESYEDELIFPLEENFISELAFNETEITLSLSELGAENQYIYILDYLIANPMCGETEGCPVNNLSFSILNQSDSSVAYVSGYYLELLKVGEITISAFDSMNEVTSSNSLKVIVVE